MGKQKGHGAIFFCVWLAILSLLSCLTGCRGTSSSQPLQVRLQDESLAERSVFQGDPPLEETYGDYLDRMVILLADQEGKIESLKAQIHLVSQELVVLEDELSKTLAEQVDLRLGLAAGRAADLLEVDAFSLFDRYIVQEGDTLVDLALERYGSKTGWLALYQMNQEVLPSGPDHLEIGTGLLMPCFLMAQEKNGSSVQ